MIKSNDLRIGNFVKTFEGGKKKLLSITAKDLMNIDQGSKEVFPVAITKEWLVKFRFTATEQSFVHFAYTGSHLEQHKDGVYFFSGKIKLNRFPVIYIHQLQNAFYWLTGEELSF